MTRLKFNKLAHIYFIGIGGVSMSGLAKILLKKDFVISGSDIQKSSLTLDLEKQGVKIFYKQIEQNITEDIDYVVYTAAINENHPELIKAKQLNIPLISRASLLADIMSEFKEAVAISGTHGKTSTTAMISQILLEANLEPTISIGGSLEAISGNIYIGNSDIFVTEACEYTNSFLDLNPSIEIILNIEEDHLDFFKDINDIRSSFKKFIDKLNENNLLIINSDIENYEELIKDYKGKLITVGSSNADISAKNIKFDIDGNLSFSYYIKGKEIDNIKMNISGQHNIYNALFAIALADYFSIDKEIVSRALAKFRPVKRRFEQKGKLFNSISIIDDYAHHPKEIEVSLRAARNYPHKRIICVFQPHTYTRTKAFKKDFAKALSLADIVILAKIYPARETDDLGVSSQDIVDILLEQGKEAYYIDNFNEIEEFLLKKLCPQDMCITMGAGDIVKVGESLLGI